MTRVAVAVSPRLLGDTLAVALRAAGLTVVVVPETATDVGPFDLAVVNGPSHVDADVFVRLPDADDEGLGSVRRAGAPEERVALADLRSVITAVGDNLPRLRQRKGEAGSAGRTPVDP